MAGTPIAVKQVWRDTIGEVRVMAVAEGYVMARRKGCAPFMHSVAVFREKYPVRVK